MTRVTKQHISLLLAEATSVIEPALALFSGTAKVSKNRGFWELLLPKASGSFATLYSLENCLWKEILSQQRIRHFKILQSIYFAYDVGIISSYSNRT